MKLPISKKFKLFLIGILVIGISLGIRNLKLEIRVANAQIPSPAPIPCNVPDDPEFHSLRPYPFAPCQTSISNTAKFCGNDLTLHLTAEGKYPGNGVCTTNNNKVTCTYSESVDTSINISLTGSNLPIMGNTEDVPNSQPPTTPTPLTDAEKMNGYVSWYLNGVMNRAEDGSSKTADPKTADYNTVNFSGPLNKLLPSAILDAQRIKSIDNVTANTNHNQIVACMESNIPIIGNVLKIGAFTPINCYAGNDTPAQKVVLRLKCSGLVVAGVCIGGNEGWDGSLSLFNSAVNVTTGIVDKIAEILPESSISRALIEQYVIGAWNKKTPPLPWNDGTGKPFATEDLYMKAYNEWRGKACVIIPVINKTVCFENIFVPNYYSDLYSYIPLSSTEDLKGSVQIDGVSSTSSGSVSGVALSNVGFIGINPSAPLFFPHMQESTDLAGVLQDTFVAESEQGNKTASPTDVSSSASCSTVEVRSNKGDKLLASPAELTGTLHYDSKFSCDFNPITTTTNPACVQHCLFQALDPSVCKSQCQIPSPVQTCTKNFYIGLSTSGDIPKADDVWSQLVAGPQSIFKRMFPKTNTAGSVGQIIDIPGSTNISYTGTDISQSNADLKFPHIGGISEYFLKGIQTALRPKGYGEPITFAPNTNNTTSGNVDCDQSAPDIVLPNTINKEQLHQMAINWEGGKEGNHVLECYNDVARKSLAAGISPAFTFLMWINESGGSNYNISNQDWGINSSQITGLTAQLERFLQLPSTYKTNYPQCFGKTKTDTEVYFDLFAVGLQGGQCVPGEGHLYMDLLNGGWNWFTTCPMANYPFRSSCY